MTDKEIAKLRRKDLLEILYFMRKEIDALKDENDLLKSKLESVTDEDKLTKALKSLEETNAKLDFIVDKFR